MKEIIGGVQLKRKPDGEEYNKKRVIGGAPLEREPGEEEYDKKWRSMA